MIRLTSKIVSAYLANNTVPFAELPDLIRTIHAALANTAAPVPVSPERQQPAVPLRKSVIPDALFCLECGKPQKVLKRHLQTAHDLSVDAYRAKWSLPTDYPMVAETYAARRSELAKAIGLGTKPIAGRRGQTETAAPTVPAKPAKPVKSAKTAKPSRAPAAESPSPAPAAESTSPEPSDAADERQPHHRHPASRWSKPAG
jgi:predicted transcriptional regulator